MIPLAAPIAQHKQEAELLLSVCADTMVFLTQETRKWLAGRYVSCNWVMPEFLAKKDESVEGEMRLVE